MRRRLVMLPSLVQRHRGHCLLGEPRASRGTWPAFEAEPSDNNATGKIDAKTFGAAGYPSSRNGPSPLAADTRLARSEGQYEMWPHHFIAR